MRGTDLLTIGDCSVDLYMKVSDSSFSKDLSEDGGLPKMCFFHGTKIPVESFETSIGGNSLHVALGACTLGLKSAIYTETGDDENTARIIKELTSSGVSTEWVSRNKGTYTDVHAIIVFSGERTIFSYHGVRDYKVNTWGNPKFIYYTSIGKGFEHFQDQLVEYIKKKHKGGVAFNPGTIQLKSDTAKIKEFLQVTDILFVNKEEAKIITGSDDGGEQMHRNLNRLGVKLSVVTDGSKGASGYDGKDYIHVNPYSDERPIADKTGAGDAFSSAFISAVIYGKNMEEALKWGVINSGTTIKVIGSIKGLLNKKEIERISENI